MSDKIFGKKDGDPVEVYPVWEDRYLKNMRIDQDYLKAILLQSGGKLKGNYYIITPGTCALLGDTVRKTAPLMTCISRCSSSRTKYWKMSPAIFRYRSNQVPRRMSTILSIPPDSISMTTWKSRLKK